MGVGCGPGPLRNAGEYGSAKQVFDSPRDEYTKALFAAAPGRNWEFGKFATA